MFLVSSAHCLWHPAGDFSKAFAPLLYSTNVTHCSSIQYCSQYRTAIMCLINLASPRSFPHSFDCFSLKTERKRQSCRFPHSFNLETSSNWHWQLKCRLYQFMPGIDKLFVDNPDLNKKYWIFKSLPCFFHLCMSTFLSFSKDHPNVCIDPTWKNISHENVIKYSYSYYWHFLFDFWSWLLGNGAKKITVFLALGDVLWLD